MAAPLQSARVKKSTPVKMKRIIPITNAVILVSFPNNYLSSNVYFTLTTLQNQVPNLALMQTLLLIHLQFMLFKLSILINKIRYGFSYNFYAVLFLDSYIFFVDLDFGKIVNFARI
ncbi:MAG: hypothetical protein C3F13_15670 [Anaerolineales bacterium]|nr:MAG: hypothetical protein C3F13_15670 [Anaerolineales bacterium]